MGTNPLPVPKYITGFWEYFDLDADLFSDSVYCRTVSALLNSRQVIGGIYAIVVVSESKPTIGVYIGESKRLLRRLEDHRFSVTHLGTPSPDAIRLEEYNRAKFLEYPNGKFQQAILNIEHFELHDDIDQIQFVAEDIQDLWGNDTPSRKYREIVEYSCIEACREVGIDVFNRTPTAYRVERCPHIKRFVEQRRTSTQDDS